MNETHPLELTSEDMQAMVSAAMQRIVMHIESLPQQPASGADGAVEGSRGLIEGMPSSATGFGALLDLLFNDLIPHSFNTAGPGYLAYIPGGGIFHSAVADLIANATNRYIGVNAAAPALVQLEANVVRWFCQMVGYGEESGGVLTSGGSISNLIAVVTARTVELGDEFARGSLYASTHVHHSLMKAARLAGFPEANVRAIAVDANFRMQIDALETQIAADRTAGFTPFFVAGSAGTTNTGAVDDLDAIADVAAREAMWMHVDGAYGGFFMLTEKGRSAMRGIERADSIILDPHKTLFLPYGTGAVLVRDRKTLLAAHSSHADYLPEMQDDPELYDFCELSPELSRDFRGLRVWLPLKMHGIDVFRDQLEEKLRLTEWATEQLRTIEGIEIVAEPQLSIVAFRYADASRTQDELNALNRRLLQYINGKQRVMMTPTVIDGNFVIRICVVSFRTHQERMQMAIDDVREGVAVVSSK